MAVSFELRPPYTGVLHVCFSAEGEIRTRDQGLMSPHLITCKKQVAHMEIEFPDSYLILYMAVF